MRGALVAAVVAVVSLGADAAPRSVTVGDPCGDIASVVVADGDSTRLQPEAWDRNDLAELTITEVRGGADEVTGVDVLLELCDDTAVPTRPGEFVDVRWGISDACWASAAVGHGGNAVHVTGSTAVVLGPDTAVLSVRCRHGSGYAYDLVTRVEEKAAVELAADRVTRSGRMLRMSLVAAELGELGALVSAGATIDGAVAVSYAATGTGVGFDLGEVSGGAGTADWTATAAPLTLG